MAYSPLACKFIPAYEGNYTKNRKAWGHDKISEICIHYICGDITIESLGNIWKKVGRKGSSNYGIGSDGRIACYVDENDIAWCNSNWDSNCRSASIETANLPDSSVTEYALNSLIRLVADIAKRNGMGKLVKGKNLTWHSMYTSTSCPGAYLLSKIDYIAEQANILNGQESGQSAIDQVLEAGSKCIFNGIFNADEVILPSTKYPNGAVGSYALCYGSPVGNNDWIPLGPIGKVDRNKNRVDYNSVIKKGNQFMCDTIFTVKSVEAPTKYTPNGVATLEADGVEFKCDCGPLLEV